MFRPEYRNGSLFVDFGVFKPNLDAISASLGLDPVASLLELPPLPASHPAIVEWRALTVVYLDKTHHDINKALGEELTLAQVLEAGTWKAVRSRTFSTSPDDMFVQGREIAKEKREDRGAGSAVNVLSDGTVF